MATRKAVRSKPKTSTRVNPALEAALTELRENDRLQAERLAALSGTVATLADTVRAQGIEFREEMKSQREEMRSQREGMSSFREEMKSQREEMSSFREEMRFLGVRFEQLQSQVATMLEGMLAGFARLDAKIDAVEARLLERIGVLEEVVRQNSADIRQNSADIRQNSADIRQNSDDIRQNAADIRRLDQRIDSLQEEVARLRHDFEHRKEHERFDVLERRVAALEARLGMPS
ncbi:hypothetical protein [Pendulispora albinea]|uniref:Chromosome partition protein Smc n=1 Tax=Pendulispora albinea TaxID=2741071 RepID=A0ABZ2M6E9_9BACT